MLSIAVVHSGGPYQERVREYLESRAGSQVATFELPANLPLMLDEDEAAELVPAGVREAEVVIAIELHPNLLAELPYVMNKGAGKALLAPREDPGWIRDGLINQVTRACVRFEIESAFPKPFCSLEPKTPIITQFCDEYAVGRHTIGIECEDGRIAEARSPRSSACGLTAWAAEQLVGRPCDESLPAGLGELLHLRPCFASMALDAETGDTIMHRSLEIIEEAGRRALEALEDKPS